MSDIYNGNYLLGIIRPHRIINSLNWLCCVIFMKIFVISFSVGRREGCDPRHNESRETESTRQQAEACRCRWVIADTSLFSYELIVRWNFWHTIMYLFIELQNVFSTFVLTQWKRFRTANTWLLQKVRQRFTVLAAEERKKDEKASDLSSLWSCEVTPGPG